MADEFEERLKKLEEQVQELKSAQKENSQDKWKAIAVGSVWIFVAVVSFSPYAAENFGRIVTSAVLATGIILFLWNES